MPIIRNTKIQNIKNEINKSKVFSINDFKFEFPDDGNVLASIHFRALPNYSFNIEENTVSNGIYDFANTLANKEYEKVLQTIEKPGKDKNIEINNHENIDECIETIYSWLIYLDEDLKNNIEFDIDDIADIEDFEIKLNEKFTNDTEKFTESEKVELTNRLEELQKRIEKLEESSSSKKSIEILEQSKNELQTYPKKSWWLKFYNRTRSVKNVLELSNELQNQFMTLLENFK
ncbi:hypothetical protein SMGD1_0034 [Sulfurimonas gotlandica GD1]|uniref:Uncharacterized protein n=1 Tax=Sulfurimonas gotlandica (strain DSM 19862 / JCM 16533 / GD1) TaxID=929558 RepID=B6BLA7_SULGG|nr:hypothetical protein [Sulfurimonas gotlandica]EDZ62203.1 hypothetical protein CBGD1_2785 [Sulfurimonas gotlandica GD1]EHP28561.1 hypothetical protein SMGD1_0034 [Sulfurimonas gotlandica GD1]